jgi:uncharacterized RDD family membrane protein YckC
MESIDSARCGRRVTSEAPRCPECGADPRTGIATFKRGEMDRVRICQGVWIRCLALFIDFVVVVAITLLASLAVYLVLLGGGSFAEVGKGPSSWPLWVAAFIGAFAYFWWCEAVWGRTLGKRLCDLRVVRRDGAKLGAGEAFVRNVLRIVDWLPLFYLLGAAVIWATPGNQRIGDLAARSAVVRTKLVAVSRLDDASLPVVPWSALTSSRRSPQATVPGASRASSPPTRRRRCARRLHR